MQKMLQAYATGLAAPREKLSTALPGISTFDIGISPLLVKRISPVSCVLICYAIYAAIRRP